MRFLLLCALCSTVLLLRAQDTPPAERSQIEEFAAKRQQAETEEAETKAYKPKRIQTIAIGADLARSRQNYTIAFQGSLLDINAEYVIQPPQFSLIYQRQLVRKFAPLFGELQVRYFSREESRVNDVLVPTGNRDEYYVIPLELDEVIDMRNIYLYPGLNYHFGKTREFLFFVGAGATIALPIASERSVSFISANYPEFPREQTTSDIQETSFGYYYQAGIQMHFPAGIGIGITLRQESLEQNWAPANRAEVINSRTFVTNDVLTPQNHFLFQCQLMYSFGQ